jgi:hypothetical protein
MAGRLDEEGIGRELETEEEPDDSRGFVLEEEVWVKWN